MVVVSRRALSNSFVESPKSGLVILPSIMRKLFALAPVSARSEEHTSELQSPCNLVCRLLLEKKKNTVWRSVCDSWLHLRCAHRLGLAQRSRLSPIILTPPVVSSATSIFMLCIQQCLLLRSLC